MKINELTHNLSVAFVSQLVSFGSSAIAVLVLPKVLGVTDYSYWQLFLFYAGYVGLATLGLNDGIYLVQGGRRRNVIDKGSVKGQFLIGIAYQIVIALIIMVFGLIAIEPLEKKIVLLSVAIYMLIQNASLYFGYVFQAMNETRLFSYSIMVSKGIFIIIMVVLMLMQETLSLPYIAGYIFGQIAALVYCLYFAKDFFRVKLPAKKSIKAGWIESVSAGSKLLIANTASLLILGISRFVIENHWGIESFGYVSLALSLVSFSLTLIMQVSLVLFPALRESSEESRKRFFCAAITALNCLLPVSCLVFYPIAWLLGLWLPQYEESIQYLAILLPVCVFDGKMNICGSTFLKVFRKEGLLLKINIISMLAVGVLSFILVSSNCGINAILYAAVLVVAARSLAVEILLSRRFSCYNPRLTFGSAAIMILFSISQCLFSCQTSFVLCFTSYVLLILFNRDSIRRLIKSLK